jgi:hypothetical protein
MTHDIEAITEVLRRKNRIEAPKVTPVALQVRTAIGFQIKQDDESKRLLADRPGAARLQVVWEYTLPQDSWNDFTAALREAEPPLFAELGQAGAVRYLGTYVIQEKPEDDRLYVTTWGCATVQDAKGPSARDWPGPQEGKAKSAFEGVFRFIDLPGAKITTRGLGAAVED